MSDRLPLAGRWIRAEEVTPALTIHQSIVVEQTHGGDVYEVPEQLFERLLTEAGYVREEKS